MFVTLVTLVIWCVQISASFLGCPEDPVLRAASQKNIRKVLLKLIDPENQQPDEEVYAMLMMLVDENTGTSAVVHDPTKATGYATSSHPLPCAPGILTTEFLQLLWLWKKHFHLERVSTMTQQSDRHFAFLRVTSWMTLLSLGYGDVFAAGQALCATVPRPPETLDLEETARVLHTAWPGSTPTEATIFKQFHVLTNFDYRACVWRFLGDATNAPNACRGRGMAWPHRQWTELVLRQSWACGVVCRFATAFAYLAEALLAKKRFKVGFSEDQEKLIQNAQAQILLAEAIFGKELAPQQVQLTCSLTGAFPIFLLLARLAGLPTSIKHRVLGSTESSPGSLQIPNQPPPPTLAKLCDKIDRWPPEQRLTEQGAVAMYSLVQTLGALLDEFGVKWWMSAGALLGTVRNGGMLPQDCDVDIALWRPDASQMLSPSFKAALAAAGIVSFHMPIYFQYRFCWIQIPAAADIRSMDGGLACYLPYVDGHLADIAPGPIADQWHYIHRTDLQYAHSFPLRGILGDNGHSDMRQRRSFGEAHVWIPNLPESEVYLNAVYGEDWRIILRGRYGKMIHNLSGESFWQMIVRPTGPLRDVLQECPG